MKETPSKKVISGVYYEVGSNGYKKYTNAQINLKPESELSSQRSLSLPIIKEYSSLPVTK